MCRYLYYARSRRAALAAEKTESKSMVEVTRQIAKEWAGLCEDDKKEYFDAAAKDKERYRKEMERCVVWFEKAK